ncbi:MAG: mitochondrial fission ELM1 family protein [Phenylobacterium sp.]
MHDLNVWSMTTGEAGLRQQANGLAAALAPGYSEIELRVSRAWAMAPRVIPHQLGVDVVRGDIAAPWPDVLVSCGRRSALVSAAIRRRARTDMVCVQIQPPSNPADFDLVVSLPHDRISAPNVMCVETALHGIRTCDLLAARVAGHPALTGLPRPWTGVLIGGSTLRRPLTADDVRTLCAKLDALRDAHGGSLLITTSRRTPQLVLAALGHRYAHDLTVRVMDPQPPNPYLPILALSDRIVVTGDSISMISEALSTPQPVQVFDDLALGERHTAFLASLYRAGRVSRLGDETINPSAGPINSTERVAERVRSLVRARRANASKAPLLVHA